MAKYEVRFSCGHIGTVQPLGKGEERQWKIDYMEHFGQCSECYKKARQEAEAGQPVTFNISLTMIHDADDDMPFIEIALTGGTYAVKDQIKEFGYSWGDVHGGFIDFFSSIGEHKAWVKLCRYDEFSLDHVKHECDALQGVINNNISIIDLAMTDEHIKHAQHISAEIVSLGTEPQRPDCYPKRRWNGVIYKGNRAYIDGEETILSAVNARALRTYMAEKLAYDEAVKAIKAGKTAAEVKAEAEAKKAALAALKKPVKPACYPEGRWNGNFYRGGRIYVDGKETKLPETDIALIVTYLQEVKEYNQKIKAIG
jgi:hypothetical protein